MNKLSFAALTLIAVPRLEQAASELQAGRGFSVVRIPKRRGGWRTTLRPTPSLDIVLTGVRNALSTLYVAPDCVHGYVRERDTTSNAKPHCGRNVVLRVDLEDFFGTITSELVSSACIAYGFDEETASLVAALSCPRGQLAAGFPCSPTLSNMVFKGTDELLVEWSHLNRLVYTRYADDLVFSGDFISDEHLIELSALLENAGWHVNSGKTRFMRKGKPQFVTGLYVGLTEGPRIPRRLKRYLRLHLHYLKKYGYEDCHARAPWTPGSRQVWGLIHYIRRLEPDLAEELADVARSVDFQLPERIGVDDEWDALLEELGVPEDF